MLYLCRVKPLRHYLRGFLIAAWAGDKIAEFSFPEISFHFSLRPWFFFVSPAYAGKSHSYLNSTFLNLGSPPRMRGKGGRSGLQIVPRRITPAYAGKSFTRELLLIVSRDHPRVCGEKNGENGLTFHQMGSPPRMRGKVGWSAERSRPEGITPAYAGKSFLRSSSQLLNGDHPRVCGEKTKKIP